MADDPPTTDDPPAADTEFDATAYDDAQSFVYEHGADLVDLLDPAPGERVLDIGCGTGHLSARVVDRGATVVGVDASPSMLARARELHGDVDGLRFVHADATEYAPDEPFDAAFSNAALHWISDQDAVLSRVAEALVPDGRFVAELGGTGNVASVVDAVAAAAADRGYTVTTPWHFPSVGEYATRLEANGFEVHLATLFDRPTTLDGPSGLRDWLDQFGDELLGDVPADERDTLVADVEDALRPTRFDGEDWTADYRRLRVVAHRDA